MTLTADIRITGAINDEEFAATGEASGDPTTGEWRLQLDYSHFPANWHPFLYIDAKIGLLFVKEHEGCKNLLSLADGAFRASTTIDFGGGYLLRNNALIERLSDEHFRASYLMHGTTRVPELMSVESFEEVMVPLGDGRIAGMAVARWRGEREAVEAVMCTRYSYDTLRGLDRMQLRRFEAKPALADMTFSADYHAEVGPVMPVPESVPAARVPETGDVPVPT
jgi:hypothetical protein